MADAHQFVPVGPGTDVEFGRRLWDLDGLSDEDVATAMMFKRKPDKTDQLMDMLLAKKRAKDRRKWLETKGNLAEV